MMYLCFIIRNITPDIYVLLTQSTIETDCMENVDNQRPNKIVCQKMISNRQTRNITSRLSQKRV